MINDQSEFYVVADMNSIELTADEYKLLKNKNTSRAEQDSLERLFLIQKVLNGDLYITSFYDETNDLTLDRNI
tara:strand:- start:4 stop:222 length:219 start_codon:yes stop_codon:yes gene_type:complete